MITRGELILQGFVCSNCKWCKFVKDEPHEYYECDITYATLDEEDYFCSEFEQKDKECTNQ